jgi:hypothetical protein
MGFAGLCLGMPSRRNEPIRNRVRWTLVLAAALTLACRDAAGPTSQLPFQLSYSVPAPGNSGPSVVGTSTAIIITARLAAPTPCFDLAATVNHDGAAIDITVTVSQTNVICEQPLSVFDYQLALAPIARGTYHVTVHHVGAAGSANTTFAQDVTVSG